MRLREALLITERPTRLRWLAPLTWMGGIFWLSAQPSLPSAPEPLADLVLKKTCHFVLYAVLAVLWMWALTSEGWSRGRRARVALLICALYAVSDEVHQMFVPGRGPRVTDVLIDIAGAWAATRIPLRPGI